ncbi:MAG TPA: hypothetical protein VFM86_00940 [Pedococcus sp.]|nr:hypothetical protein [Pedococcus sp.]
MSRIHVKGRRAPAPPAQEDPVVRQYRFLLREAPPDAVEAAHRDGLGRLSPEEQREVLGAVQRGLVAGQRLRPDDTDQLAHLVVLGERRTPNAFIAACSPSALRSLSRVVVASDACFGLFGRYAAWDGKDPEPEDDSAWADAGFNPDSGRWNPSRKAPTDASGIASGTGGGLGGDGGGGG